jgi:glycerol-3-phosphate acyltransferase PlsY
MDFLFNINVQLYLAAYLIGAIPFGLLLAKTFGGVDIRSAGSRSIGATNVLRVLKEHNPALAKKLAAATLGLDAIKGAALVLVVMALGLDAHVQWSVAVLAVIGHCFSPFLKFEGGKGVATGVGILLVLSPLSALVGLAAWYGVGRWLKISSISSLSGLLAAVLASLLIHPGGLSGIGNHAPLLIITFIVFYKHIPNLIRLFKKEENAIA